VQLGQSSWQCCGSLSAAGCPLPAAVHTLCLTCSALVGPSPPSLLTFAFGKNYHVPGFGSGAVATGFIADGIGTAGDARFGTKSFCSSVLRCCLSSSG